MTSSTEIWNQVARRGRTAALALLLAAACLCAAACRSARPLPHLSPAEVQETLSLFEGIPQEGIALGDPAAPVTLTEFSDLQCPFCKSFALGTLPALIERYVRPGKLRIEFRDLAFLGAESVDVGRTAAAVGLQDRQWQFVHLVFMNQGEENTGYVTPDYLRRIAAVIPGVDVALAMRQRDSPAVLAELDAARALAARFEIRGTPSFLLGKTGAEPAVIEVSPLNADQFAQAIDALLPAPP